MKHLLRTTVYTLFLCAFAFSLYADEPDGADARRARQALNAAFNKVVQLQNQGKTDTAEYTKAYAEFELAKQRVDELTGPSADVTRYGNSDGRPNSGGSDVSDEDITSDILNAQPVKSSVSVTVTIEAGGYVTKRFPVVFASDGTESGFLLEGHVKRVFNSVRIMDAKITDTNPRVIQLIQPDKDGNFRAVVDTASGTGPSQIKKMHFRLDREKLTILVMADGYHPTTKKIMLSGDVSPETIYVNGKVTHNSGKEVKNAAVTVKYRHFMGSGVTDEFGNYSIEFDVAPKTSTLLHHLEHPNTDIVLDRPVGIEVQAWRSGFEAESSGPIVYAEQGQPGLIILEGVVMDDGIPPSLLDGVKITVLEGMLKSDNPETGTDGKYKVYIQPNLFDPSRPAVKKTKNFVLKPSPLVVKLAYKTMDPDYFRFEAHNSQKTCPGTATPGFNRAAFIVAAGSGPKSIPRKAVFNVQASLGREQLKDVVLNVRHDGYWRNGTPSAVLAPPTGLSSTCQIDQWGGCQIEFDQPRLTSPPHRDFNPHEHFPIAGRLIFEYTDPSTDDKLECIAEYTIVTPLPLVQIGSRGLNDSAIVDPEKYVFSGDERGVISITLSDWDSRSFDIEIYGNGEFSTVTEDQRRDYWEDLPHGVRCNIHLADSPALGPAYTWKERYDIEFTPAAHTMSFADYIEKSNVPSDQLIKNLAYLGAETVGHQKIIQAIAQTQKLNSKLSAIPGGTSVAFSGGFLVVAVKKLSDNGEVIERISRFKLGNKGEITDTSYALGDIWVPACDLAIFGIGAYTGGTVPVFGHVAWQGAKMLYELGKHDSMLDKRYDELLGKYESIVYEPILIVIKDSEGNITERTIQLPVTVKMPKENE